MRTYKLTIVYDGTRYQGWQRQKNTNQTIQGILETSIGKIAGYRVEVNGSGRTDGGVHAKGQTASIVLFGRVDELEFCEELNKMLPNDIRVTEMLLVKNGYHARQNAKGKRYEYFIDTREKPDVFARKYCFHYPHQLNIAAMEEAAGYLIGKHDFSGFTDKKEGKSTIRTIYDIIIENKESKMRIEFYGTGFLYHMIRILTGTLLEIGTGEKKPVETLSILEAGRREDAGFLAPARGLFLKEVYDS